MADESADGAPDWTRAEEDLRWCLIEGRGVEGRDVLFEALQMPDAVRRKAALHNGFMMSRRDEESTANFVACERADALRLYNLARGITGLPPVA